MWRRSPPRRRVKGPIETCRPISGRERGRDDISPSRPTITSDMTTGDVWIGQYFIAATDVLPRPSTSGGRSPQQVVVGRSR
jgi:hypothetical protein